MQGRPLLCQLLILCNSATQFDLVESEKSRARMSSDEEGQFHDDDERDREINERIKQEMLGTFLRVYILVCRAPCARWILHETSLQVARASPHSPKTGAACLLALHL